MGINWDIYNKRLNANGSTERERQIERLKTNVKKHVVHNPSYKDILLNGEPMQLVINTGTKPQYKEFESLPGQSVKIGDYIEWANRTWLVYEADADDEIYIDGKMYECNYKLYWQDSIGKIISKWAYIQNASSYSNGESGNATLTLSSNQFLVIMPLDDDTINLTGTRMIIDNVASGNPRPYELTRPDNVSMKFGDKGCTYYIFTLKEFSIEMDKKVTLEDGSQVWICNYITPTTTPIPPNPDENPDKTTDLWQMKLNMSGSQKLRIGGSKKVLAAQLVDEYNNEVTDCIYVWTVKSDYLNNIRFTSVDNSLSVWVTDELQENTTISITVSSKLTGQEITKIYPVELGV